jgi:hypothetical protein
VGGFDGARAEFLPAWRQLRLRADTAFRAEGGMARRLRIGKVEVVLSGEGVPEARHRHQNARGELLDMEAELGRILNAVDPAGRAGRGTGGDRVRIARGALTKGA